MNNGIPKFWDINIDDLSIQLIITVLATINIVDNTTSYNQLIK